MQTPTYLTTNHELITLSLNGYYKTSHYLLRVETQQFFEAEALLCLRWVSTVSEIWFNTCVWEAELLASVTCYCAVEEAGKRCYRWRGENQSCIYTQEMRTTSSIPCEWESERQLITERPLDLTIHPTRVHVLEGTQCWDCRTWQLLLHDFNC